MDDNFLYLAKKFSMLIEGLIIGEGNAKERLLENSFLLHSVFGLNFPEELNSQKEKIIKQLSKFPVLVEDDKIIWSSYDRTIQKIRKSTASKIIKEIYNLYIEFNWQRKINLDKTNR
ncbi:hypothetical protein [Flavobacterium sp. 3HN19-14]|uniref:hypothetical protein n=1 Tax=Flavobacterium sp. 3HN19-14 TaxID=3448133 RepID=UPI003EE3BCBC